MNQTVETFWQDFLRETGRPADLRYQDCYHFEITETVANALLDLVLKGQKRATTSLLKAYEWEGIPAPTAGNLSIITDFAGNPRCVIETQVVTILPYKDMTYEICSREGEDDTLASWQAGHEKFFQADCAENGETFSPDMEVVFEDFAVVYAP